MVFAKPARPVATVVDGVLLKPPFTIRVQKPEHPSTVPSGYDAIDYTIYFDYCREQDFDPNTQTCASYLNGLGLALHATGSVFDVRLQAREYYTGSGQIVAVVASNFTLASKHTIDLNLSGCNVSLAVDGKTYLQTNMFKEAQPLTRINFEAVAYQAGSATDAPTEFTDPAWIIDVITGVDIASIINIVVPIAVSAAVAAAIIATVTKLAEKI